MRAVYELACGHEMDSENAGVYEIVEDEPIRVRCPECERFVEFVIADLVEERDDYIAR